MTWPYSKHITSTDDQTEMSGTIDTIRKDINLQRFNRLRWEKPLRDELLKIRTQKTILNKRFSFDKHYYERKLNSLQEQGILSANGFHLGRVNREMCLLEMEPKKGRNRRMNMRDILFDKFPNNRNVLPVRRELKWSLNHTTKSKIKTQTEQEALAPGKNRVDGCKTLPCDKLPTIIKPTFHDREEKKRDDVRGCLTRHDAKRNDETKLILKWINLSKCFPQTFRPTNH